GAAFLVREWEQVILAQDLRTLEEYQAAPRPGRSVPLDADDRELVWNAIQHVAGRLRDSGRRTLLQLASDAANLLGRAVGDLLGEEQPERRPYRHIVVDEAQDLHPAQWRLLRAAVPEAPNDLFIVGDPHQRMFDTRIALTDIGIPVRRFRLKLSYRLSHEVLSWSARLRGGLADGLVPSHAALGGFRALRHGPRPIVRGYVSLEAEIAGLVSLVAEWIDEGVPEDEIAVTARTPQLAATARSALREAGITGRAMVLHRMTGLELRRVAGDRIAVTARPPQLVATARSALREAGIPVRVMVLHGMKGLEFRRVAVIGVADGVIPAPDALTPAEEDPVARAHDMQRERGL